MAVREALLWGQYNLAGDLTDPLACKATCHASQEAAEGRMAHNNGWNGVNGMVSNPQQPCVGCVRQHSVNSVAVLRGLRCLWPTVADI